MRHTELPIELVRDALANERTFLAYLRTALAFIAFGFVIARFALFEREISLIAHLTISSKHTSVLFGMVMALTGVVVALYGAFRYVGADRALRDNKTAAMPGWAAVLGGFVVCAIGIIVGIDLSRFR